MSDISLRPNLRWYQGLDRYCWVVLIAAALGWLFDTMDQNLFTMVKAPSVNSLLRTHYAKGPELDRAVADHVGIVTAVFLAGWATGGFIFGVLGDRIGRTKTMVATILMYAAFTGLSGIAQSFWFYSLARFLTGMGVGGEWAAGAALVAETFPVRSRAMALGTLQALSCVGNISAAVITLNMGNLETGTFTLIGHTWERWRLVYFIGAIPALLVIWVYSAVREPDAWKEQRARHSNKELGNMLGLFKHPLLRRRTIVASLMATAGVAALWGVAFLSPDMVRTELKGAGLGGGEIGRFMSWTFIVQQIGGFAGIYAFSMLAERFGRRPIFIVWFAMAWGSILAFFWGLQGSGAAATTRGLMLAPIMGFATLGPFAGYAIYFPELFPTRLRATGCGFTYNVARYLAALAPFALGKLSGILGGFAQAATIVSFVFVLGFAGTLLGPETRGKPLPDDL